MEIENWYAAVDGEGFIIQFESAMEDSEGPSLPPGEYQYHKLPGKPELPPQPTPTSLCQLVEGALVWVQCATLAEHQAAAIVAIDTLADAARAKILSQPTNSEEYKVALSDATSYRDAGFSGPVPEAVRSWAHAKRRKGWTAQMAAEDILATAQRWQGALYFIRDARLDSKELVRDASSFFEVDVIRDTFTDTLTAAMQGVQ